jgi:predicted phage terminase large subunit-like protein
MAEAQLQQHPVPRGGNIIKTEDWRTWDKDVFPKMDFLIAALDTAYTEKTQNDPAALIIWGLWHDEFGNPKIMMIYAWSDWLELNPLVRRVLHTCTNDKRNYGDDLQGLPRFPVDTLVIEGKASGLSVQQEISRLIAQGHARKIMVDMVPAQQLRDDKIARLVAVSHLFGKDDGIVYAPSHSWADAVIDQVGNFPYTTHDDYVDCTAHGLRWYRNQGFAPTREERFEEEMAIREYRKVPPPLYGGV